MCPCGLGARVLLPDLFSQDRAFTVWMQSESGLHTGVGPALNWQCLPTSWHHDFMAINIIHCLSDKDASTRKSILPLDRMLRTEKSVW